MTTDWKKEFDEKYPHQYPHQASIMFERKQIKDFIQELLDEQKKEFTFQLATLRQLVGEGDISNTQIYDKLNEIAPLMTVKRQKEIIKQLKKSSKL